MDRAALNEMRRSIKEYTLQMDNEEYADFMRDLAEWANNEAELAEYHEDLFDDETE